MKYRFNGLKSPLWGGLKSPLFSPFEASALSGAGGVSLPAGAIGVWYMDDYSSSPRKTVRNSASSVAVSPNLLMATRRLFNNTQHWGNSNCTVVDGVSGSLDGTINASTVTWGSADAYLFLIQSNAVLALTNGQQYTLSFDAQTTDASTVDIRSGRNAAMQALTITPTMTRYSVTFTFSTGDAILLVRSKDSATPANLKIDNATLHLGAADLGRDTLAGHIMLGMGATAPGAGTTGLLDFSTGAGGLIQFLEAQDLTAFTIITVGSRTSVSSLGALPASLTKIGAAYTTFSATMDTGWANGGGLVNQIAGSTPISGVFPGLTWPRADELHAITHRYGDGSSTIFEDDCKAKYVASTGLDAGNISDFWVSWVNNSSLYARYKFAAIALWPSALTDAEIRQAYAAMKSRVEQSSLSVNPATKFLVAEGDSITYGTGSSDTLGSYANRSGINLTSTVGVVNAVASAVLGTSSDTSSTNSLWGRKSRDLSVIPPNKNGRTFILTILIGRNDLVGYTGGAAQYAANVVAYAAAMKAGGFDKVAICTLLPSTGAGFNTARNSLNAIYTGASWASDNNIDAIIDLASVSGMGADADASNASNYGDGTHPTNAGYALLEPTYRAAINAL